MENNNQNNHDEEPEIMGSDETQRIDLATLGLERGSTGDEFHRFLELTLSGAGEWSLWTIDEFGEKVQIGEGTDDEALARQGFRQYIEDYHAAKKPNITAKGKK